MRNTTPDRKAIRVFDGEAGDRALVDEPLQERAARLKDRGLLHAEPNLLVDVEEATIVDFVRRSTPDDCLVFE